MSTSTSQLSLHPLLKHRLAIFLLSIAGGAVTSALQLGFIPSAIASGLGALLGEVLTYEQSQS